jgi:hypothetical protein
LRKEKRDNAIKLLNKSAPNEPIVPILNADVFKDNITTFLEDNNTIPDEIVEIAKYVADNPDIIETIIEPYNELRCLAYCYNKKQCTKNRICL